MRVKICGITQSEQARAIAQQGATELGFICVQKSPRYLRADQIAAITSNLPHSLNRVGVFANAEIPDIIQIVEQAHLTAVQLHGQETPTFCQQLRSQRPELELIKAIAVKTPNSLTATEDYRLWVDAFLLDAYAPQQLGGTGQSFNWDYLKDFHPQRPWFLAGGLTPHNIQQALSVAQPDGIDLSSGVENSPGDKNLDLVAELFQTLQSCVIGN